MVVCLADLQEMLGTTKLANHCCWYSLAWKDSTAHSRAADVIVARVFVLTGNAPRLVLYATPAVLPVVHLVSTDG